MSVRGPRDSVIVFAQFETVVKVVEVTGKVGVKFTHFFECLLTGQLTSFVVWVSCCRKELIA